MTAARPPSPPTNNPTAYSWLVYIIEASDGCLYTGITNNMIRRWQQHSHQKTGAKFFRGRTPRRLCFIEPSSDRSQASQREAAIKKLTRRQKQQLITQQTPLQLTTLRSLCNHLDDHG